MSADLSERVLPQEVQAYLIDGQPPSTVIQNSAGCYLVSNEISEPRSGYYLRDRSTGEPLCYDASGMRVPFVPAVVTPAPAADA